MYRGQDIGDRTELTRHCLTVLESGQIQSLYAILPHLSLLRDPVFLPPLFRMLEHGTRSRQLFSAVALGTISDPEACGPLEAVFQDPENFTRAGTRSLQTAAIFALGEIGRDQCVDALMRIYRLHRKGDAFTSRRRRVIITALGSLAQGGNQKAEQELMRLLNEKQVRLRARAVFELGVAYWSRPESVPEAVFVKLVEATKERSKSVRQCAWAALRNLAELDCRPARDFLDSSDPST